MIRGMLNSLKFAETKASDREGKDLFQTFMGFARVAEVVLAFASIGAISLLRKDFGVRYYTGANVLPGLYLYIVIFVLGSFGLLGTGSFFLGYTPLFLIYLLICIIKIISHGIPILRERVTKPFPFKNYSYSVGTSFGFWRYFYIKPFIANDRDVKLIYEPLLLTLLSGFFVLFDPALGAALLLGALGIFFHQAFINQVAFNHICDKSDAIHMQESLNR